MNCYVKVNEMGKGGTPHGTCSYRQWGLTLGCVAMLDLVLLFLVTLVVVFNTLATFSMLLEANYAGKLFPTPYTMGGLTLLKLSLR